MKIYTFGSGDTTYFTTSSSLKKAQAIGKANMEHYLETCKELEEKPEADESYFIPTEVEPITKNQFKYFMKTDPDTLILNDELYQA